MFETMRTLHKDFDYIVEQAWKCRPLNNIIDRLDACKLDLQKWGFQPFGNLEKEEEYPS